MKIRLLALGSRMDDWVRDGFRTYQERLPGHIQLELIEIPLSTRSSGGDPALAIEKEGARILKRLRPAEFVVALDERGRQWASVDVARELERWQKEQPAVALLIGGPEGLSADVKKRANQLWSLSALTLPHGLVRVVVAEQLYRAWTITQGHPYHKA